MSGQSQVNVACWLYPGELLLSAPDPAEHLHTFTHLYMFVTASIYITVRWFCSFSWHKNLRTSSMKICCCAYLSSMKMIFPKLTLWSQIFLHCNQRHIWIYLTMTRFLFKQALERLLKTEWYYAHIFQQRKDWNDVTIEKTDMM